MRLYNCHFIICCFRALCDKVRKGRSLKYLLLFLGLLVSTNTFAVNIEVKVNHSSSLSNQVNSQEPNQAVIVFLTPQDNNQKLVANQKKLVISQQDKKFTPYIAVTQRGSQVVFENKDDITHHIYSVSGQNNFEFKVKAGEHKLSSTLDNVEEVAMGCNIHDWMNGYVLVVDTPYYQKTNEQGIATFDLLHAGSYTLSIWHPQLDEKENKIEQVIEVTSNNANVQTWTVTLPNELLEIPTQENQDDFDFLEEY